MGSMIELTAADGHKFSAYKAEPAGKPRGGVVVVMEIFRRQQPYPCSGRWLCR